LTHVKFLDNFGLTVIADPLDKSKLSINASSAVSSYGRIYSMIDGVFDLRLLPMVTTKDQLASSIEQKSYEDWNTSVWLSGDVDYILERENLNQIYSKFDFVGKKVLDPGGGCGLLRHFLPSDSSYMIVDPHLAFASIDSKHSLLTAYPFLLNDVNFIRGDAEFLPICSSSFDVVHMRSCIDHFPNPELALYEAFRVLVNGGDLIIGTSLEVDSSGVSGIRRRVDRLTQLIGRGEHDHHSWHPTLSNLVLLLTVCGFKVQELIYQTGYDNQVVYLFCKKSSNSENYRRGLRDI